MRGIRQWAGLVLGMQPAPQFADRSRAAVELLELHEPALRRAARRVSICPEDAEDALQRALEILLTKSPTVDRHRLVAWMTVVTRHEALAVRRVRERALSPFTARDSNGIDPLGRESADLPTPEELAERRERVVEARHALARLKADERRAIVLQAEGYSYAEICERCGWTYTKVNRCLAEGRAALRAGS